jgi:tRNA uridine 5-carboxymethylaminomethyl modification enzyme
VQIKKAKRLYNIKIPLEFNFTEINNIALEAREKLQKIKPETLGHASQISGINPSDINVLEIYIEQNRRNNDKH